MPFGSKVALLIVLILLAIGSFFFFKKSAVAPGEQIIVSKNMKITSPAFENNQAIPAKYTCDGENVSPPLGISGVPAGAESLVLIADDPDAPRGTWVHWLLWNIDSSTSEIAEGSVPPGAVEGATSFGKPGWGGPCPPSGTHRYFFKLYALDKKLEFPASADKAQLEQALEGHILERAELVGLYQRR